MFVQYLRLPTGGVAYGTPRKASTGGLMCMITPLKGPYLVLTTLVLYLCTSREAPAPESSTRTTTTKTHIAQKNPETELNCFKIRVFTTRMTSPKSATTFSAFTLMVMMMPHSNSGRDEQLYFSET